MYASTRFDGNLEFTVQAGPAGLAVKIEDWTAQPFGEHGPTYFLTGGIFFDVDAPGLESARMTGVNLAVTRCPENFASPSPNDCQVLGAPANIDLTWTAAGGPTTSNYQQITRLGSCLVRTFDLVDTFRTAPAVGTLELEGRLHTSTGGSLSSAMTTSTSRCVLPPSPPASAAAHPRRTAAVVSWHDASSSPRWPVVQYIATAQPGGASWMWSLQLDVDLDLGAAGH